MDSAAKLIADKIIASTRNVTEQSARQSGELGAEMSAIAGNGQHSTQVVTNATLGLMNFIMADLFEAVGASREMWAEMGAYITGQLMHAIMDVTAEEEAAEHGGFRGSSVRPGDTAEPSVGGCPFGERGPRGSGGEECPRYPDEPREGGEGPATPDAGGA